MSDPCDPDFADVVLLLDCDGANGSTTFTDLSPAANVVTPQGGATVTTTNPQFGTGCLLGDSSGYLSTPVVNDSPLDILAAGDFTIEGWARVDSISGTLNGIFSFFNPGLSPAFKVLRLYTVSDAVQFQTGGMWAGGGVVTGGGDISANVYFHWAVVRVGNDGFLYIDGVQHAAGSGTWTGEAHMPTELVIGEAEQGVGVDRLMAGAIDEVRITRGLARYTTNFTPPTAPFPTITCAVTAIVPDVVGDDEAVATAEIEYVGLVVGAITTAASETVPAGEVISSDPIAGTEVEVGSAVNLVVSSGPPVCGGIPFEGYIAWPYLDFGILGIDKMMEGFDIVANGIFRVSFGYSQRDFSLATPDYELDGDTLVGGMVPMPLTAPSFQLRLTFDGEQAWEWFASNLYINNEGPG